MRLLASLLVLAPALAAAASAPVAGADPVAGALREAAEAAAEARRLEAEADRAGDEAARLRGEQQAAAAEIAAAEARISAADLRARTLSAAIEARTRALAEQQRPASALLAGLAQMSRRPPLLALADRGSVDDYVRVRALLGTTLPVIRARTAGLRAELDAVRRLRRGADAARAELAAGQQALRAQQQRLAGLERQATARSARLGAAALGAGDVALASGEEAGLLAGSAAAQRSAWALAAALAPLAEAPPRPGRPDPAIPPPLAYSLPLAAPLTAGLGEVSPNGVRSRGLAFRNGRGVALSVPADGRIAFAGPFRRYAGVVIIDHGGGWMTMLTNAATPLAVGTAVSRGEPLGRSLGAVGLELTHRGEPQPAALIAGSSSLLSKGSKSG
ncbi:metalloendopeptidase [Sphingomonas ginkgonis]|uniref:Metalloendopeptidase n=1 Tax=Sphingomonas ginkgonis TaxID=2315330 RepID=A0A3R9WRA2_9SPHN|nr:peptidoglycan DD-metalloendopeptidase family protein [Sphingomonas ginkgonis]RST29935.1 metalloendopeptidase [Sphingomonas ginkgonis]